MIPEKSKNLTKEQLLAIQRVYDDCDSVGEAWGQDMPYDYIDSLGAMRDQLEDAFGTQPMWEIKDGEVIWGADKLEAFSR